MVLDELNNAPRYESLHPAFASAFRFLREHDCSRLAFGRYEIDGERVFAIIDREPGRGRQAARLEAHRRYIDVRFIIDGTDEVGWKPTGQCRSVATPYDGSRDLGFFADPPDAWVALPPGTFAIFFPEDAHAPLAGEGEVHKVIVKVRLA